MLPENNMAYKEWSSVTEALARGMHIMSLRKGGIHEKRGEFTVEHREFFFFPTYIHQRVSDLTPDVLPLLEESQKNAPPEGQVPVKYYVTVEEAKYIESLDACHALAGLHPFTREGVEMRFNYKKPGLWAIVQRLYALPETQVIEDHRLYAGCRSWVPLQMKLSTVGAKPVMSDKDFGAKFDAIKAVLK